jgi:hypothetical protein
MFTTNFDTTPQNDISLKFKTKNLKSKYQFSITIFNFIGKSLEDQMFESIATKIFYGP